MSVEKNSQGNKAVDRLKWLLVIVLFIATVAVNSVYGHIPGYLRLVSGIVMFIIMAAIAFTTFKGREMWQYFKESRNEVRRVVWPTRQMTLQMTLMVVVMVLVVGLAIFVLDQIFLYLIGWITG